MKFKGNDLIMVRGDDESITITMYEDGVNVPFVSGDTVTMTVRLAVPPFSQSVGTVLFTSSGVLDATTGSMVLQIIPSNTNGKYFGWGVYVYDIQADLVTGGRKTIRPESPFVLLREVTVNA